MARRHNLQSQLAATLLEQAGLALVTPGNAPRAESLARQSLKVTRQVQGDKHPDTAWALWTLANILADEHNDDEAGQCYQEALAIVRDHFGDSHYLAHTLREELKFVLLTQGDQAAVAALHAEQSAYDVAALADYDKAVALYPNSPWRLMHRGSILALQGDMKQANLDLTRAAELTPENVMATYMRAGVCFSMNNEAGFRQASLDLAEAAERGSDRMAAFYAALMFVVAPNSAIDESQALKFAQKCFDARPDDGVAIGLLGATLFRLRRYEEAAQRLTECLEEEGGHFNRLGTQAYGYLFLAMTHHHLDHSDEANDWLNRAVENIDARQGIIAYWPGSMFAERLRQETEALLGVEREVVKREAVETIVRQAPTMQPQLMTDPKLPDNQASPTDN